MELELGTHVTCNGVTGKVTSISRKGDKLVSVAVNPERGGFFTGGELDNLLIIDPATGLPELERRCTQCADSAEPGCLFNEAWNTDDENEIMRLHETHEPEFLPCDACDMSGFVPTAAGRALLTFINRTRIPL